MKRLFALVVAMAIAAAAAAPANADPFAEGFLQGLAFEAGRVVGRALLQPAPPPIVYGQQRVIVRRPACFRQTVGHPRVQPNTGCEWVLAGTACIRTPRSDCVGYANVYKEVPRNRRW